MGIEPTRRRAGDASTALKAAGPTRRPDTPQFYEAMCFCGLLRPVGAGAFFKERGPRVALRSTRGYIPLPLRGMTV